jgi:hypothetical protein
MTEHISKHYDKHESTVACGGRIIKNTRYAPPRYVSIKVLRLSETVL